MHFYSYFIEKPFHLLKCNEFGTGGLIIHSHLFWDINLKLPKVNASKIAFVREFICNKSRIQLLLDVHIERDIKPL